MCKIWRVAPQTPFDRQSIDCPSGVTWWVKYSKSTAHLARHSVTDCTVRKRVQQSVFFFSFLLLGKSVFYWRATDWRSPYTGACLYIHTLSDRAGCEPQTQASCAQLKKKKKKTSCMHTSLIIKTTLRSQTFKFQANAHVLYKQMNIHPILLHVL